jgi:hypothetical protein
VEPDETEETLIDYLMGPELYEKQGCRVRLGPGTYRVGYGVSFGKAKSCYVGGIVNLKPGHTYIRKGRWCLYGAFFCGQGNDQLPDIASWIEDITTGEIILRSWQEGLCTHDERIKSGGQQ